MGVNMNYGVSHGAAIRIDAILFYFGGYDGTQTLNKWQYYNLPDTIAPTSAPSSSPTSPSNHPSFAPSSSPTNNPSAAPTVPPIAAPTDIPSPSPTNLEGIAVETTKIIYHTKIVNGGNDK